MGDERREKLKNAIIEQVQGKLSEEQINTILDSITDDVELIVTDNPYEFNSMSMERDISDEDNRNWSTTEKKV